MNAQLYYKQLKCKSHIHCELQSSRPTLILVLHSYRSLIQLKLKVTGHKLVALYKKLVCCIEAKYQTYHWEGHRSYTVVLRLIRIIKVLAQFGNNFGISLRIELEALAN